MEGEGLQGSPNAVGTPDNGSAGTTPNSSGEQPGASSSEYALMDKEELLDRLQKSEKSYNEYRSMTDKKLQDISGKYKKLEQTVSSLNTNPQPTKADYNKAAAQGDLLSTLDTSGIPDETLAKLRTLHAKDPVLANIAIVGAAMNSMKNTDPVMQRIKEQQLIKDGVTKLGDNTALSHADEIREIMYEYNMNPEHESSAKAAFEIWKGRNVKAYQADANDAVNAVSNTPQGDNNMDSHNEGANVNQGQGIQLSEAERRMANMAVSRGVFKDFGEFNSFKKMMDNVPKTSDGKYLGVRIDDIPQEK